MNRWRFLLFITVATVVGLGAWFARGTVLAQEKAAPARPAAVWEYKIMWEPEVSRLGIPDSKLEAGTVNYDAVRKGFEKLGRDGWELAAVESGGRPVYYFKRPQAAK